MVDPEPPPRQLVGQADPNDFVVTNDLGVATDPHRAIVPIIKQDRNANFELVGTGFFIAQSALVATAKHVARDFVDRDGNATHSIGIFHFLGDGQCLLQPFIQGIEHNAADVAIAKTTRATHNETGLPPINYVCKLTTVIPPVGSKIFTYAYPKTTILHGSPQRMTVAAAFYAGEIVEYLPNGRDSVMLPGPCFRTSMVIHGGASGGPVFDDHGNVFAINSTGLENEAISYVSSIHSLLELELPSIKLGKDAEPQSISVRDLGKLGHVKVDQRADTIEMDSDRPMSLTIKD
jgi:hypothetical protein